MNKFTLFSIVLSLIIILMVLELVRNDYLTNYNQSQSDGFGRKTDFVNQNESAFDGSVFGQAKTDFPSNIDKQNIGANASELLLLSQITQEIIEKAGFVEAKLEQVDFNNLIFQKLEVNAGDTEQVLKFNVFENEIFAASIYETLYGNPDVAKEFYNLLMEQSGLLAGMVVNVTNSFAQGSYYINVEEGENVRVMLVVLFDKGVYVFEYPHANHSKIKKLIELLLGG